MDVSELVRSIREFRDQGFLKLERVSWRLRFECLRCGRCCHMPVFLTAKERFPWDINKYFIPTDLGKEVQQIKKDGGCCPFLQDNTCLIYLYRPRRCRTYPFYFNPEKGELFVDVSCPGIGRGKKCDLAAVKEESNSFIKDAKFTDVEHFILNRELFLESVNRLELK